jgi:hypothetical protein
MSELVHAKDKGTMIDDKNFKTFIRCNKCGFKVLKSDIYDNILSYP